MTISRRSFLASGLAAGPLALNTPFGSFPGPFPGALEILAQDPRPTDRVRRFENMAFGLFVHWGLYAQLGAGEWVKKLHGIDTPRYMELMKTFTAKDFSGRELARVAKRAGMRYVTLTSRHHDGFSLYDTAGLSPYDVTKTPAGRDLIADFCDGCRAEDIVPMLYCTTLDWTDPRFEHDWKGYQEYLRASIRRLCTQYGPIGGFWFDGNWSKKDADWETDALYAVIREHQPEALIINNTGLEQGGKLTHDEIDAVTFERGRPSPLDRSGMKKYVTGEMCLTFNQHWGIATNDFNLLSPAHVIEELLLCRRAGANLLMNVGPTAEGRVPDYERAALARVGDWIRLHGGEESTLYEGRPQRMRGTERDFALRRGETIDLFVFDITTTASTMHGVKSRGAGKRRFEGVPEGFDRAIWLDDGSEATIERNGETVTLDAKKWRYGTNTVVRVARLSQA
ncbi:MAG: alpha-L-fucosidase [Planctomycetes bacterium]|nr:alpha-L-fucosidase [Planctomycetota bacterium]